MWLQLTTIEKVTDFDKHYCSQELKAFLRGDRDMFAEIASPGVASSQSLRKSPAQSDAPWDATGDEEDSGYADSAPAPTQGVPSNPSTNQSRRRPGRSNYIK